MAEQRLDKRAKLHIVITAAWMVFIFVQSALPGDVSGAESNVVVQWVLGVLHALGQSGIPGLSGLAGVTAESLSFVVRKAAHFTEYAVLGGLLVVVVRDLWARNAARAAARGKVAGALPDRTGLGQSDAAADSAASWQHWPIAWLIGTLYAATDEIHQAFVPERACALMDVGIDATGVAVGAAIVIAVLVRRVKERKQR